MFVKQNQPTPFWTHQDGVIGTAHLNRAGDTVDFRPAAMSGPSISYQTKRERETQTPTVYLMYLPAKGVVGMEPKRLVIWYTITQVQYLPRLMMVWGENPQANVEDVPMRPTLEFTTEHHGIALHGFPMSTVMQAAVAEMKQAQDDRVNALLKATSTFPTDEEIVAGVAGLAGLERRWVRRWATLGKAHTQAAATVRMMWPNVNTERVLERIRVVCVVEESHDGNTTT